MARTVCLNGAEDENGMRATTDDTASRTNDTAVPRLASSKSSMSMEPDDPSMVHAAGAGVHARSPQILQSTAHVGTVSRPVAERNCLHRRVMGRGNVPAAQSCPIALAATDVTAAFRPANAPTNAQTTINKRSGEAAAGGTAAWWRVRRRL